MTDQQLHIDDSEERNMVQVLKYSLADIQSLLQEGFDSNIYECTMSGVSDTIFEIRAILKEHDPEWLANFDKDEDGEYVEPDDEEED